MQDYLEDERTSSKKFWEKVQYVTSSKSQSPQINLVDKNIGNPVSHNEISEYINDFFINIGPNLARKFQTEWVDDLQNVENCMLCEFEFIEREIIEVIKEIDIHKSSSIDIMSTRVFKDAFECLVPQLTHMFNCSMQNNSFPDEWKRATVVPMGINQM